MKKEFVLRLEHRQFKLPVEGLFAEHLEKELAHEFNMSGNNEITVLLKAYLKKSKELFYQQKSIEKLTNQVTL